MATILKTFLLQTVYYQTIITRKKKKWLHKIYYRTKKILNITLTP